MSVNQILSATATGAGSPFLINRVATHTMQMSFTNAGGSCTALVVDLEGSIDGANWAQIDTHTFSGPELAAKVALSFASGKLVLFVRANIITLTDTGVTTVIVSYLSGRIHKG